MNIYRVYETRIVRRKGNMSECGARAPVSFYVISSIVDERMQKYREKGRGAREGDVYDRERKRKKERAREKKRERERLEYVNDFTNVRPWDRRKCAGAPSNGWADRMNVNAS